MLEGLINKMRISGGDDEDYEYEYEEETKYTAPTKTKSESNVKEFPKDSSRRSDDSRNNIIISRPREIDDAKEIIDQLMEGCSVTIDLEKAEGQVKQRIMDMIVGYGYCANCNIERVNETIFVVSHADIQVND